MINVIESISDPAFLGAVPAFQSLVSWQPWLSFEKAVHGLPMDAPDLERFQRHTGRHTPRSGGYPEAVCIVGCQSGKSQIAAADGVYAAAKAMIAGQRGVFVVLIAQDTRSAQRALFGYVKEFVTASPMLQHEIVKETADTIELSGGVSIAVYPSRPAAIRGIRATRVIIDELAFFTATDGRPTDTEMVRAARTRTAMTGGRVVILTSPYGQAGAAWDLHKQHFGQEDSSTLVWQASAPDMNPLLPHDYLCRMEESDPEAYRSEVLGEFRAGISTLFDYDALDACVDEGVREREPEKWPYYVSFVDAASGSGKDAFTLAIAHPDGDKAVVDLARAWNPPFNPSAVIAECADLLKRYRLYSTSGDRYAGGFTAECFRACGITYRPSELDRSQIYLECLPAVNARRAALLDRPDLLRELRGLQRSRGTTGRDRVDHRSGQHDDLANSVCGAISLLTAKKRSTVRMINFLTGKEVISEDEKLLRREAWQRGIDPEVLRRMRGG